MFGGLEENEFRARLSRDDVRLADFNFAKARVNC